MRKDTKKQAKNLDPATSGAVTESGELERPRPRRKIDCGGNPEIRDLRNVRGGGGREVDQSGVQRSS